MLDQIGVFDDRLFLYYEDTDLFWRAQKRGWKLVYCPSSVVRHVHAGSSGEWSTLFTFYAFRNRYLVVLKNGSLIDIVAASCILLLPIAKMVINIVIAVLSGSFNRTLLKKMFTHIRIILSSIKNAPSFLRARLRQTK